jgi:Domain of unknown function (DUF4760)
MSYTNKKKPEAKRIWAHLGVVEWVFLAFAVIAAAIAIVRYLDTGILLSNRIAWCTVAAMVLLAAGVIGPIISLSRCGHTVVAQVCVVSGVTVLLETIGFYFGYFAFIGPDSIDHANAFNAFEKILNVPPVLVAIWAAAIGWYVSYQAGNKNQRTANAFSIVMQTRTNAEFLRNQDMVRRHFPVPTKIEEKHRPFFASSSLNVALERLAVLKTAATPNLAEIAEIKANIKKIRAIRSFTYLMNFYEFMAVGIGSKDLDEDMLYQTISTSVVSTYRRGALLTAFYKSEAGGSQALVFQYLDKLVKKWEEDLHKEQNP